MSDAVLANAIEWFETNKAKYVVSSQAVASALRELQSRRSSPDRGEVIEECAKVAQGALDSITSVLKKGKGEHGEPGYVRDNTWSVWTGEHKALTEIVPAIRALKSPSQGESK